MKIHFRKETYGPQWKGLKKFAWHELSKTDLILFLLGILFCFLTMYYWDITVTSRFSLIFIDSLFDGKFLSFYDNALSSGIVVEGAVYDIGFYLIFALWGLPVWILQKVVGLDPMSVGSLLWFKCLLLVFVAGSFAAFRRILTEVGYEKEVRDSAGLMYLLSPLLIFPVLVSAQYDIIPLYFILEGISCYLQGKKKSFLILSAVAMTTKPFAILPAVALILLREKKIRRILLDVVCSLIPMMLLKMLYSLSPGYRESCGNFLAGMLPALLNVSVELGNVQVSVFVLGLIAIYIYAYAQKETGRPVEDHRRALLVVGGVWAVFCLFVNVNMNPYWSVYLAPFLVMAVFMNGTNLNLSLILELVFHICLTILFVLKFTWVYGGSNMFEYLLLKPLYHSLMGDQDGVTVAGILRKLMMEELRPALGAALVASIGGIFLLAAKGLRTGVSEPDGKMDVWHVRARIAFVYVWILLSLAAFALGTMGY